MAHAAKLTPCGFVRGRHELGLWRQRRRELGQLIESCEGQEGCDASLGACVNACDATENNKNSVGCEYYPTFLQHWDGPQSRCFAAFVANTWSTPANVFFADPTYPATNLVVVRARTQGSFQDVELDCAGTSGGWNALGSDHEWTWFDLTNGDFQPNMGCEAGRHEISGEGGRFGLWVWG